MVIQIFGYLFFLIVLNYLIILKLNIVYIYKYVNNIIGCQKKVNNIIKIVVTFTSWFSSDSVLVLCFR